MSNAANCRVISRGGFPKKNLKRGVLPSITNDHGEEPTDLECTEDKENQNIIKGILEDINKEEKERKALVTKILEKNPSTSYEIGDTATVSQPSEEVKVDYKNLYSILLNENQHLQLETSKLTDKNRQAQQKLKALEKSVCSCRSKLLKTQIVGKQIKSVLKKANDEMKLKSVLEFDNAEDEIVGPYNYMQFIMVRGLFSKWKQPIFIDFDRKITKDIPTDGTRQNVRRAAELLSHTTATALIHYEVGNKIEARALSEFIEAVNKWFHIFNSYIPINKIRTKSAYEQWVKTVFKPFMSIISLKMLFDDMNQKFSASYILTHRLNQDYLEKFFFQVRSGGGVFDHPSALDALSRVRMIVLGKNPGIIESHTCTEDQQQDEYMVAQMFHRANVSINSSSTINDKSENGSSMSQEQMNPATVIDNGPETTGDALECIGGYIAKKYKKNIQIWVTTYTNIVLNMIIPCPLGYNIFLMEV
ncbi:hypothetical protein JTB14_018733 [Gonioctena quinquepunctata]|nr:hypothetical protein JTB14_018733 [Gonioctena quinquepunctata]